MLRAELLKVKDGIAAQIEAWAFIEAAHFAVRYDDTIRRWFQKKCAKTLQVVAIKAVAHKLARACFHVMKTGAPFDAAKAFG